MAKARPFPGRVIKLGDAGVATVLPIQRRLDQLGCKSIDEDGACVPIDEDGVFGPQTFAAVKLFQARFPDPDGQPLKVDGLVGALTWAALFGRDAVPDTEAPDDKLLTATLEFALTQVGTMERPPGSNRGPEVDAYLRSTGIDPRTGSYPWCAAFVYFCFLTAARKLRRTNPVVRTAGVLDHWNQARRDGIRTITAAEAHLAESRVQPGHIFVIDTGGGHGHTGLVEGVVGGKLITIEGNTNDVGGREGVGVFRRESRRVRDVNLGFIDYGRA